MTARADWVRVEAALDEILALPEADWPQACARIANGDAQLLIELNSLLAHTGGIDPVLDRPMSIPEQMVAAGPGLEAGTRIGAYRVVELIGRGGMGEVYRAERADGQYQQQVALKLIRGDLVDQLGRFHAERQILAQLQHPGIARLLDGGVFNGLPFMAIELVPGLPINDWCARAGSDLSGRLRLFTAVCDAVAHAHSSLVVHRDIKPGNVLVTEAGEVKLLDFGVAKLLSASPVDVTRNAPMTPAYSAPEQLTGGAITTATDVYALGVLLYELLCGELPWKSNGMSFGIAVRKVLNESVPLPSRCARHSSHPPVPWNLLRGDLDAILTKTLRKEPEHRYATVNALREDVARVLRHEPVSAREGARLYIIGRFVRRQPWLVASAAAILVLIVAGSLGIAWQAREALAQAQRAEKEGQKATAVKNFLLDIFKQSSVQNPGGVEARQITAQQLLDVGATRIKTQLLDQPEVREELMDTLVILNNDLGLTDRSTALATDNLAELQRRVGDRPSLESAKLKIDLAMTLTDSEQAGAADKANELLRQAQAELQASGAVESRDAAHAYYELGRVAYNGTRQARVEGQRDLLRALDMAKRQDPSDPRFIGGILDYLGRYAQLDEDSPSAQHWLTEMVNLETAQGLQSNALAIGEAYFKLGDFQAENAGFEDAERNLRQAITLLSQAAGAEHPAAADSRSRLGEMFFYRSGRRTEAAALLNEALQAQIRTALGRADATETRKSLGNLEFARGRWAQSEQLFRENLAQMKGDPDEELRYGLSEHGLVIVLIAEGQLAEARQAQAHSIDIYRRYLGEKSRAYARAVDTDALLADAEHRTEDAAALFDRVRQDWPPAADKFFSEYTTAVVGNASTDLELGNFETARRTTDELLQTILSSPRHAELVEIEAQVRRLLGEALRRSANLPQAQAQLQKALELRQSLDDADSPALAQVRIGLAQCLIAQGKKVEAQTLIGMAEVALSHQARLRDVYRQELKQAQVALRKTVS